MIDKAFAKVLRELRLKKGLSQETFAFEDSVGWSAKAIQKILMLPTTFELEPKRLPPDELVQILLSRLDNS